MKVTTKPINDLLSPVRQFFLKDDFEREDVNKKPPLRSELLSMDQMESHAAVLAHSHIISHRQEPEQLLKRLSDNEEIITKVSELLHTAIRDKKSINPAGDWLLDNFYLIEEHIQIGKRHLPKGYSKGLPKLENGKSAGMPRVYDIALEIISHSDGHVNLESLVSFIVSYQNINHFTLGELWAIPIMLRLALLENLRRVSARLAVDFIDTDLANTWADRIIKQTGENPKDLVLIIGDMARAKPPMVSAFVAKFVQRLQSKGLDFSLPLSWIEQHLSDTGYTINSMVLAENQKQSADQVSMSNSINSLRFLTKTDWRDFVEDTSIVEKTLRTDPKGIYASMDFHTRDRYRHAVEKISKKSRLPESNIAQIAISLAKITAEEIIEGPQGHVGYYLIGDGKFQMEQAAGIKQTFWKSIRQRFQDSGDMMYLWSCTLLTLFVAAFLLLHLTQLVPGLLFACLIPLMLFVASYLAINTINWFATIFAVPRQLPKMNFSKGIPDAYRTLVVIPSMIVTPAQVAQLLEDLEVRFLSNRDPNLLFGLLTDWMDAPSESLPEDGQLLELVKTGIEDLNHKYGRIFQDTFLLFHRFRTYQANDNIWMGYERKRGKLGALNQLLRGKNRDQFLAIVGEEKIFPSIRYVITVDTDTQLPREAGWKLVGLMAHPLNQAVYCEKKKRITKGYGIIQPRLSISLHGATRSLYSKLHENDAGIDPYTRVTSDVYQDIFGEGSFIGKGIYDVDAFEKVTHGRFPENRILSHDLLEGAYARCGFASDVQFYEDHPSSYASDAARRQRWVRGDWQIFSWALPFIPNAQKKISINPLSVLSKWKIADNLRRSLLPLSFLLLFLVHWLISPQQISWMLYIAAIFFAPLLLQFGWNLFHKTKEIQWRQHADLLLKNTAKSVFQIIFTIALIPYESFVSINAILRTLWRMGISKKKLLEWNPSGLSGNKDSLKYTLAHMWFAPMFSLGIFLITTYYLNNFLFLALPVLLLWFVSPGLVWWMSQPLEQFEKKLNENQLQSLRILSRKTWTFFEDMVGPADNWLPPDNLQLYPEAVVAHRTSPTNIGLSLLSNLAAHDFGYITTTQFLKRISNTFDTMEKMERYAGHFYNWYDTQNLMPLYPRYVSSVDSGNLAGHLLTLRQGLIELQKNKIIRQNYWNGLEDTLAIILSGIPVNKQHPYLELQKDIEKSRNSIPPTLSENRLSFLDFSKKIKNVVPDPMPSEEILRWMQLLEQQVNSIIDEISLHLSYVKSSPNSIGNDLENSSLEYLLEKHVGSSSLEETIPFYETSLSGSIKSDVSTISTLKASHSLAEEQLLLISELAARCTVLSDLQFDFLYETQQHLLSIGYNVEQGRRDESFYDLLASESRLSSFIAISQGKLPQESWFALGRRLTSSKSTPVLLSWSGSMFEFLMPNLVMPCYDNTLLDTTSKGIVKRQIEYGKQNDIPWGISESCYNLVDAHQTYQYKAFGVPGLGFKRGLGLDLVVAPYATVMALMVDPSAAYENLERMRQSGYEGKYGFYEAIDFTKSRLPRGKDHVVIQSFMAHHQGMGFLSLASLLLDKPMQRRFGTDMQFQTALLLLQERIPKSTGYYVASAEMEDVKSTGYNPEMRIFQSANTSSPQVQLLSNGKYHVMVTNAGSGYSRWKDLAVNRWREDSTCDNWGSYCYVRNLKTGDFWSSTHQPTLKEPSKYTAVFSEGRAEFFRLDHEIETRTEIIVSPEDDIEIRRSYITNQSNATVLLEITTYAEVVMAPALSDESHPAFSNLFVQTELLTAQHAIVCSRRPKSEKEHPPFMMHLLKVTGANILEVSFETDRNKFIGRRNTLECPDALQKNEPLSNSQGSVLDPIVSIRYTLKLGPKESVVTDAITGISDTKENTQLLIDKYQDKHLRDRAFELSFTHAQVVLRQINASDADAQLFNQLASPVIFANIQYRASPSTIFKNQKGQSSLWSYSISGDIPIVLLKISDSSKIDLVKQLMQARIYWKLKGLETDLVILNEDPSGYRQVLQEQIITLIAVGTGFTPEANQAGIYLRMTDQIPSEDRVLLETVARVIITDHHGTLAEQLVKQSSSKLTIPRLSISKKNTANADVVTLPADLKLFNGLGGFTPDGKEYIILTSTDKKTPLPWSNVIANKNFGTIVSESASSYTWFENAHSFRLSPWHNDPVKDVSGEAMYLRDEETGNFWSPSPLPAIGKKPYITRHGFGYSVFEHLEDGIYSELWVYVDTESSIKFMVLKVKNRSGRYRKLSATGYVEWVLGTMRSRTGMYTVSEKEPHTGALVARNSYNMEFPNHVAFLHTDEVNISYTSDRYEFIGRNGTLQKPKGLRHVRFSESCGAGLDACACIQVPFELDDRHEREIVFKMGAGKDLQEVIDIVQKFKGKQAATDALQRVHALWNHTLGAVQISTQDPALDLLSNGWLMYQVLSCRLWGRSGFYQSGGAFGFRDQLQDVMSLIHADPSLTKNQILLAASRQFPEGDVQHWWHPPLGRGVRTLCSDDYLWLPYSTARYVKLTGDTGVLDEKINFIEGRKLNEHEESYYDLPVSVEEQATLYEHCKRAILHGLRFGEHGLPLMGSGDWNDGMNMVGIEGKGESVWLAWFVYDVLISFSKIAIHYDDKIFAENCLADAGKLKENIHNYAWDGAWYIRAYFDNGTPLGSSKNSECSIDSISQSWSVLSEAGDPERKLQAMDAVNTHLVNRQKHLIQLLDPPFDKSNPDPGYIRGYVPGVRENGGQYTHAAIWTVMAFAKLGNKEKTWELLKLINPLNHGLNAADIANYKVEPYVMAADVYGVAPHTGRGGWTWYTGSAGWMYTLVIESFLGLKREGNQLWFEPCVPEDWNEFSIKYRFHSTVYHINIQLKVSEIESTIFVDGNKNSSGIIELRDDHIEHEVKLILPKNNLVTKKLSGK